MIRTILLLLITGMVMASCSHTYYVVRHAEKEQASGTMMSNDPQLSEAGKVRAVVLREELKNKHLRHIYATNTIRARATADPLSQATGLAIELYNTTDSLDQFINQLKSIRKGNVLIVGHSNTVDDIVNKLCGEIKIPADLKDGQFDNLFIITYKGKKILFERRKYGYPSNPE